MLEAGLALGITATHLGVPLADLVAWALVLAFLAVPVPLDDIRYQRALKATGRQVVEIGGAKPHPVAARCQSDSAEAPRRSEEVREAVAVVPAATRLSAVDQWQAVSRLVSGGAERAMAVAREQQAVRRELDSLDFTLENLRRDLAAVMTSTRATATRGAELVPVRAQRRLHALAA